MAGLDVVTRRTVYTRHVCLAAAHGPFREMSRASRLAYDTDDDDVDDDIDGGKGVARRRFDDDEEDGQDVIASESDEEIDRAARQKKRVRFAGGEGNSVVEGEEDSTPAPDGFEPFHMKEERARGWFDSNGNFTLEEEDTREAWLKEYEDNNRSEVAIRQSDQQFALSRRGVKRRHSQTRKDSNGHSNGADDEPIDVNAERQVLLQYLQTGENVLSALKRLGKEEDKTAFSAVTEAADRLLQAGHFDVYQDTLETIQRALGATTSSSSSSSAAAKTCWEFKWRTSNDEPVHGPYTAAEMDEWRHQGYFVGDYRAVVRVVGAADPEWTPSEEIPSFTNY